MIISVLEKAGLAVIGEASDGLEAIQKARELRPDLILMDIGLPKLNGIEAARRVCRLLPNAKILFISMETSADIVKEVFRAGAVGYVQKPHVGSELLPAIEAILSGKQFIGPSLVSAR